jgi:hypothetical protein
MSGASQTNHLRDYLTFTPILGGVLAVVYDVGYFWALDIHYFFFFSLSEHVVFAMQAIPLALCIFGALWILVTLDSYIASRFRFPMAVIGILFAAIALLSVLFGFSWPVIFCVAASWVLTAQFIERTFRFNLVYYVFFPIVLVFLIGLVNGKSQLEIGHDRFRIQIRNDGLFVGNLVRSGDRGILFSVPANKRIYFRDWSRVFSIESDVP